MQLQAVGCCVGSAEAAGRSRWQRRLAIDDPVALCSLERKRQSSGEAQLPVAQRPGTPSAKHNGCR